MQKFKSKGFKFKRQMAARLLLVGLLGVLISSFQNCQSSLSTDAASNLNTTATPAPAGAPYSPLPTTNAAGGSGNACVLQGWKPSYILNFLAGFQVPQVLADPLNPDGYFAFGINPTALPTGLNYTQAGGFSGTPTQVQTAAPYTLQITSNCAASTSSALTLAVLANSGFQALASGPTASTTCAVSGGGNVCWGFGLANTAVTQYQPVSNPGVPANLNRILYVGRTSMSVLLSDLSVWSGDLVGGFSGSTISPASKMVSAAAEAIDSLNNLYTCMISAGAVSCQLPVNSSSASPLNILSGASAVAASGDSGCAIVSGAVKCWGKILASGTQAATVSGLTSGVTSLAMAGAQESACAVVFGGVRCWGSMLNGAIGTTPSAGSATVPLAISGLGSGVFSVVGGGHHFCALLTTGAVSCWGLNSSGQLGNGTSVSTTTAPVTVLNVSLAEQIVAGVSHTCALLQQSSGSPSVACWGDNSVGQMASNPSLALSYSSAITITGL